MEDNIQFSDKSPSQIHNKLISISNKIFIKKYWGMFLILIFAILIFNKLNFFIRIAQLFYLKTAFDGQVILVEATNGNILGENSSKSLSIINFDATNKTKILIQTTTGSFEDAINIGDKIWYLSCSHNDCDLFVFDTLTKIQTFVDTISDVHGFDYQQTNERHYKLLHDDRSALVLLYNDGILYKYSVNDYKQVGKITLWNDIVGPGRVYEGSRLNSQEIIERAGQAVTTPKSVDIYKGKLRLVFDDIYVKKSIGSDSFVFCRSTYKSSDFEKISGSIGQILCDIDTPLSCAVKCPDRETLLNLNNSDRDVIDSILPNQKESYLISKLKTPIDFNCGGYFQIGLCIRYITNGISLIDFDKNKTLYEYGRFSRDPHLLNHITISDKESFVAYSYGSMPDHDTKTYVLDLRGKHKPFLISNANSYPLSVSIEK